MRHRLITLCLAASMLSLSAQSLVSQRSDFESYKKGLIDRITETGQWRKGQPTMLKAPATNAEAKLKPASYWGSLYTPAGEEWMYTMQYNSVPAGEYYSTIESLDVNVYDSNFNEYRTFHIDLELSEGETSINSVQMSSYLTKKFFNINDDYEVMIYVHATTEDYTGHDYTNVYSLKDGSLVTTIPGNHIGGINTATDSWSEKYTMVFMREEVIENEEDYEYYLYFDIYNRAGWNGTCTLDHTFKIDYRTIAGAGNYALPILMNTCNNNIYYALPHYEKPYFENDWSEDITPDNHFIIDLYDQNFNLVKTTYIPMAVEDGAIFSFPGLGELRGNQDMSFGVYSAPNEAAYVIGIENYISSVDDFETSLYVYDWDGNRIQTIVESAEDYLALSPIPGYDDQYCFLFQTEDGVRFDMIDITSGNKACTIDLALEDTYISTSIDRVKSANGYKYVSSVVTGIVDNDNNVIHRIAWFNSDGSFDRFDNINLGKDIVMAMPNISAQVLDPYLFNTDDNTEYMFLVKKLDSIEGSSSKEYFRIINDQSKLIAEYGPDIETGEVLNTIFVMNADRTNTKLVLAYYNNDMFTLHHIDLPLVKFAGGEGTAQSPYQISAPGDFMKIETAPAAYYTLVNDIDFNGIRWAGNNCDFSGVLNGNGHTISNLYLNGQGMFNSINNGAEIYDLKINHVIHEINNNDAGTIAAYINGGDKSGSKIHDIVINDITVFGNGDCEYGVIAGNINLYSSIADCVVTGANISLDKSNVGGIAGRVSTSASIVNSAFEGTIKATTGGGIAGSSMSKDETVSNCHAHVNIEADIAGGIIGWSGRTVVSNCYVDGKVESNGQKLSYSGGIVGKLDAAYGDEKNIAIKDCVVAASVSANDQATEAIAHRIAGFTSGDEMLVDWESKDPNVNWEDPSTYPYIPGEREIGLSNNYAVGVDKIDANVADDAYSTEGKSLKSEELTDEWLKSNNWTLGNTPSAPWRLYKSLLLLYNETFTLSADPEAISVNADNTYPYGDPVYVAIECNRNYVNLISVKIVDEKVAKLDDVIITEDGKHLICPVYYVSDGDTELIATIDGAEVRCTVKSTPTSIDDVITSSGAIKIVGEILYATEAEIYVYNISGMIVARGYDNVNLTALTPGTYIAVSGSNTLKFVK